MIFTKEHSNPINFEYYKFANDRSSQNFDTYDIHSEGTSPTTVDIIEELIEDLQMPDPTIREKAIWELAQEGDSRAIPPLVELMMETNSQERSLILEAISQISIRTLKPLNQALTISLQDKNPQVRKNAIRDFTKIYQNLTWPP